MLLAVVEGACGFTPPLGEQPTTAANPAASSKEPRIVLFFIGSLGQNRCDATSRRRALGTVLRYRRSGWLAPKSGPHGSVDTPVRRSAGQDSWHSRFAI